MKGLIRNNFYAMEGNMVISFIVAAFLAIMPVFLKGSTFIPIILAIQIFIFVVNTGTSLHADTTAKWNKYERILPVKSGEPILAKYISFAILILLGVAMSLLTLFCAAAAGITLDLADLTVGYGYGLTLSGISIGIMYPIMLRTGTDKNELILIFSAFGSVGLRLLAAFVLSPWTEEMNIQHPLVNTVSALAALVIFAGSYFVSLGIYRHKEFY